MTGRVRGTREWLVRRMVLLLVGAITSLATSLWAVSIVHGTAETVRDRGAEAVLETAAARRALAAADRAVVTSLDSGLAALVGPGKDYTNQLAMAHQSLAKVAEAGQSPTSEGRVQLVAGLLAAYSGAIGQAHAQYRTEDHAQYRTEDVEGLGSVDLWYASRLLHAPDGVLDLLKDLQEDEQEVLDKQLDQGTAWPALLWLFPVAALAPMAFLVLLVITQRQLIKRFRRRLNLPLLAATALTALVLGVLYFAFDQHQRLDALGSQIKSALQQRELEIEENTTAGQRALVDLLAEECDAGCGVTVEVVRSELGAPPAVGDTDAGEITKQVESVTDSAGREWLVPAVGALICGLVVLGLFRRLAEYRFHT